MNRNIYIADDAALLQVNNAKPQKLNRIQHWYTCHLRAATAALGEMISHPVANFFTLLVIALAFALPATLFVFLNNLTHIGQHWESAPQISLYIKQDASPIALNQFLQQLKSNKLIEDVNYITPSQGLKTFNNNSEIKEAVSLLAKNPLPGVIVIYPNHLTITPEKMSLLYNQISQNALVDTGQMNITWVKRLYFIVKIIKTIAMSMAILFSIGVILIVGNTIRLAMQSHQDEIAVMRLIGATKAFIRRPLLYRGFFYGLAGSILAWMITAIIIACLKGPAGELAETYNNVLTLQGLTLSQGLCMMGAGIVYSLIGARTAADFSLKQLQ